jgi:predicted metal-dependent hydrolase
MGIFDMFKPKQRSAEEIASGLQELHRQRVREEGTARLLKMEQHERDLLAKAQRTTHPAGQEGRYGKAKDWLQDEADRYTAFEKKQRKQDSMFNWP